MPTKPPKLELTIDEVLELHHILYRHTYIPAEMEHAHSAFRKIVEYLDVLANKEIENGSRNSRK